MTSVYKTESLEIKEKLDKISPTICLAKWLWVSLHLPQGLTQSCYHPPTHKIELDELKNNVSALHNTMKKKHMRKQMLEGDRPSECSYCWKIEDTADGEYLSDRHYRSGEWWAKDSLDDITNKPWDFDISPTYVEVNFNQACNFKCCYCSPHLSSTWENEVREHGGYKLLARKVHNEIKWLDIAGLMPIKPQSENPYIKAFWEWWPELYKTLKTFRMTGGEPLVDHNTFKILDYIINKPNKNLELSITTNGCPPKQKTWDKFIKKVYKLIDVQWKVVCIHKYIDLEESVICAIIDGKHYFITDDVDGILDVPHFRDIFLGKKNTMGDELSDKIKYEGIMNFREFLGRFKIPDFGELFNSDRPKDFDGVQIYTIYNTFEKYVINKDFYREDQLRDLGIGDFKNITIEEAKEAGFKFDSEEYWYNHEECVEGNNYSFCFDVKAPGMEHLMLYISLDSVGEQLEYSRFGANYKTIIDNVREFLKVNMCISITFINTFNLFSIYKLKEYLQMIYDLRNEFNTDRQKIWFDLPILETPKWICISNSREVEINYIKECISYMEEHTEGVQEKMFHGFKDYEIDKLKRNLDWIGEQKLSQRKIDMNKGNFFLYFKEYDKRRETNVIRTFPELESYYKEGYYIHKKAEAKNND
jgi:hypothetical protein